MGSRYEPGGGDTIVDGSNRKGKWRPESGLLEGIDLVTSTRDGEIREGFQRRYLSCPPAAKEREVCSWQKAQLVQRLGSRTQSTVLEAASGAVWPEWAVSWVRGV